MSFNFGGSSSGTSGTQQVTPTPPDATEQALRAQNLQLAQMQAQQLQQAAADQATFKASPQYAQQQALQQAAQANLLARLNGTSPVLSPQAQQRVDTAYNSANTLGMQAMNQSFGADAAARGMTQSDSPIANAKALGLANFQTGLQGARAQSELNVGDTEANFNSNLADFTNRLQQQALMNRLAMSGQTPASYGLMGNLFQQRFLTGQNATTGTGGVSSGGFGLSGSDVNNYATGAGKGIQAYQTGAAAGLW